MNNYLLVNHQKMVLIPSSAQCNYAVLTEKETGNAGMQPVRDRLTEGQAILLPRLVTVVASMNGQQVFSNQKA